jgi:hypothetical protein
MTNNLIKQPAKRENFLGMNMAQATISCFILPNGLYRDLHLVANNVGQERTKTQ